MLAKWAYLSAACGQSPQLWMSPSIRGPVPQTSAGIMMFAGNAWVTQVLVPSSICTLPVSHLQCPLVLSKQNKPQNRLRYTFNVSKLIWLNHTPTSWQQRLGSFGVRFIVWLTSGAFLRLMATWRADSRQSKQKPSSPWKNSEFVPSLFWIQMPTVTSPQELVEENRPTHGLTSDH